jgi:hypothetical protein
MDTLLTQFIENYLGKADTGTNAINKGQCVGLIEVWLEILKKPAIGGNAKDLLQNAPAGAYAVIRNEPANYPGPGGVVVWDGTWGGGYGHTAVVVGANAQYLVVFEQNDPTGSAPIVQTHGYSGVLGWLVAR